MLSSPGCSAQGIGVFLNPDIKYKHPLQMPAKRTIEILGISDGNSPPGADSTSAFLPVPGRVSPPSWGSSRWGLCTSPSCPGAHTLYYSHLWMRTRRSQTPSLPSESCKRKRSQQNQKGGTNLGTRRQRREDDYKCKMKMVWKKARAPCPAKPCFKGWKRNQHSANPVNKTSWSPHS